MNHVFCYQTILGDLWIADNSVAITHISVTKPHGIIQETDLIKLCHQQLSEYFVGQRTSFDFPIEYHDTSFREKCYRALLSIPYGSTISYKELAIKIKQSNACRAVGGAIHHNPLLIVIPCHRVIQSNGEIGGFGAGIENKIKLLEIERCI